MRFHTKEQTSQRSQLCQFCRALLVVVARCPLLCVVSRQATLLWTAWRNRCQVDDLGGNSIGLLPSSFDCITRMARDSDEASSVGGSSAGSLGCGLAFALSCGFEATKAVGLFPAAPGHDLLTRYPFTIGLCSTLAKAINTGGGSVLHGPAFASDWGASIQGLMRIAMGLRRAFKS